MAVVSVADQYLVLMAVTMLFTILSLVFREKSLNSVLLSLLAGICWMISAVAHLGTGDQTGGLNPLAWLFFGFSIIFVVKTIYHAALLLDEKSGKRFQLGLE